MRRARSRLPQRQRAHLVRVVIHACGALLDLLRARERRARASATATARQVRQRVLQCCCCGRAGVLTRSCTQHVAVLFGMRRTYCLLMLRTGSSSSSSADAVVVALVAALVVVSCAYARKWAGGSWERRGCC